MSVAVQSINVLVQLSNQTLQRSRLLIGYSCAQFISIGLCCYNIEEHDLLLKRTKGHYVHYVPWVHPIAKQLGEEELIREMESGQARMTSIVPRLLGHH